MARIYGTIESLKALKYELESKGITRFNSVGEINNFLSNYNLEKKTILDITSNELEKEYLDTCANLNKRIQNRAEVINSETERINNKVVDLQTKINFIYSNKNKNFFKKVLFSIRRLIFKNQLNYFQKNKAKLINSSIKEISKEIKSDEHFIKKYKTEKQSIIRKRAKSKIERLEYIYDVIQKSRNLISGAIGENLVVKEINKLSDDYVLINDFNLSFSSPIFSRKLNQKISSIQIDHLLISKAGIFIIETKNWSKLSVNSLNLRSPIEQIERSNFALYVYISENIILREHHWGEQKVPIRNLIVMINNKPKEKFKFVSIKLLKELNDYIKYFEPVLTEEQVNTIVNKLT